MTILSPGSRSISDDNDPTRFLTYLVAALGTLKPDLAETALGILQSPQPPPLHAFLTGLINDLDEFTGSFALVLDDYHVDQCPAGP